MQNEDELDPKLTSKLKFITAGMDNLLRTVVRGSLVGGLLLITGACIGAALASATWLADGTRDIPESSVPYVESLSLNQKWELERQAQERLHSKYGGKLEARLWDNTRVDILTNEEAIEIDFARKWAEAIGQAKYYSYVSGKKPAIILLISSKEKDGDFIFRCQTVCVHDGIQLYLEPLKERPDDLRSGTGVP